MKLAGALVRRNVCRGLSALAALERCGFTGTIAAETRRVPHFAAAASVASLCAARRRWLREPWAFVAQGLFLLFLILALAILDGV